MKQVHERMTYHRDCMRTPFFNAGYYQLPAGRKKERLRLNSVESKERKVIRECQRAATGRGRGQLPRRAPGICGVREHAYVRFIRG